MKVAAIMCFACFIGKAGLAGDVVPKDVRFDDAGAVHLPLSSSAVGDADAGAVIAGTKSKGNCIACHAITALAEVPFHGEIGPSLDGAGARWSEAELRGLLVNAKKTFQGTMMPAFYKIDGYVRPGDAYTGNAAQGALLPILSAQEIEDVVAFVVSLKGD